MEQNAAIAHGLRVGCGEERAGGNLEFPPVFYCFVIRYRDVIPSEQITLQPHPEPEGSFEIASHCAFVPV